MSRDIIARRYSRALFAIGQEQGEEQLAAFGRDLFDISEVLQQSPELMRVFRNPVFSAEEKKAVVEKILSKVNPSKMVSNFCLFLADKDRLAFLPEIAENYSSLLDEAQGVLRGELITAVDLDQDMKEKVKQRLEDQSGHTVHLEYDVDQEIIGGLKLKVGDKVLDASIKAQLEILKENIKRGE
ncbi:MAG: ATP synthase F1 subunit delta [Desulfonatronovibrionaceae bacterium]